MNDLKNKVPKERRQFLKKLVIAVSVVFGGAMLGRVLKNPKISGSYTQSTVWQIDPRKCIQCGRCSTHCVQNQSAVKCVHQYELCGYCKLCFGYFREKPIALTEDAENQVCPTGAIQRKLVEEPYYEYTINETLCIACAKCIKGCTAFGNGSLFLQIRYDRCLRCNQCSIARSCPAEAFQRVPADRPYILKSYESERLS